MKPIPKLLSKTKLMRGYKCLKCIYLTVHHPEWETPITPELQALFDQGNMVGAEARKYFPGGILVDNKPWDFVGALQKTRELIAAETPIIYEAAFEYMGCYARADIIQYSVETKRWHIYEVKSTTKVKPEHIDDVGLQAWIMAKSGLPIEQIHIMHLNPACRYPDLSNLFSIINVTDQIRETYLTIKPKLRDILTVIRQPKIPEAHIGAHCQQPTECGFIEHCFKENNIPEISILNLPGLRDKKWELLSQGIIELTDERLSDLNDLQQRIVQAHKSGERFVDLFTIQNAMTHWQFPLIFLDFETINPAIPRYVGCGPFHQVPFQFSVHIWHDPNAELIHKEFLHDTIDDPRPTLIPALLDACGTDGTIIAYFSDFESKRIQELAAFSPEHASALEKLLERMVDPLPILREAVYDKAFSGSFSLKKVAPALLGDTQSYAGMQVANGGDAQRAFEELISPQTSSWQKQQIRHAMLEYCKKDTLVMVELVKWMLGVTDNTTVPQEA